MLLRSCHRSFFSSIRIARGGGVGLDSSVENLVPE